MPRSKLSNLGSPNSSAHHADSARSLGVSRWSDPSLYVLGLLIGLIPIIAVLIRGGAWDAEPTAGLVFCVTFAAALVQHAFGRKARRHDGCKPLRRPSDPPGDTWSPT